MQRPQTTGMQFSLRSLLILTTIFATLFGFVSAVGISPTHALVGFVVLATAAAATAQLVEIAYRVLGLR